MNDIILAGQPLTSPARHLHECWELLYCSHGTGVVIFDGLELPCHPGAVIVIPPDTPHLHPAAEEAGCISLSITNATLPFSSPLSLEDDGNHSLSHLFSDAQYLYQSDTAYRASLLPAYGQLITQHISCRRTIAPRSRLVEEIAQSIVQNYANPNYELDELLRSAPYCYDYLCRLFRQEMHTTPHKYLTNLRLQAAADALRLSTGRSVTEIARMCGYHDPLYFSRMFKKKYGVSPREYGRQLPET